MHLQSSLPELSFQGKIKKKMNSNPKGAVWSSSFRYFDF